MKISQSEIWNFIDFVGEKEKGWSFSLRAGLVEVTGISPSTLMLLRSDKDYDTEILPSIFTFREILWQPDVFTEASMSLSSLRVLKAFCEETTTELTQTESPVNAIYSSLLEGIAKETGAAIEVIEGSQSSVIKTLRVLRKRTFPIIKFFVYHPQNRLDYHRDAINRLNYAVKIMLTQFYGRYTDLKDPFWEVEYSKQSKPSKKKEVETQEVTDN